jgi:hypothetical protein
MHDSISEGFAIHAARRLALETGEPFAAAFGRIQALCDACGRPQACGSSGGPRPPTGAGEQDQPARESGGRDTSET